MTIDDRIKHLEKLVEQIHFAITRNTNNIHNKWMSESEVRTLLDVGVDTMYKIRRDSLIRTSSATGRNFKYFTVDVEQYLLDHSPISRKEYNKANGVQKFYIPSELLMERSSKENLN